VNASQKKIIAFLTPLVMILIVFAVMDKLRDNRTLAFGFFWGSLVTLCIESWLWRWGGYLRAKRKASGWVVAFIAVIITGAIVGKPYVESVHRHSSNPLRILDFFTEDDCEKVANWKNLPTICTTEGLKVNENWNVDQIRANFQKENRGVFDAGYEQSGIEASRNLVDHPPEGQVIRFREDLVGSDTVWYWLVTILLVGFIEYPLFSNGR
jgi:hypothetical protein